MKYIAMIVVVALCFLMLYGPVVTMGSKLTQWIRKINANVDTEVEGAAPPDEAHLDDSGNNEEK